MKINPSVTSKRKIQEHINNKQKVLLTGPLTNGHKMPLSYLNSQYI